jgi:hypothetical protein
LQERECLEQERKKSRNKQMKRDGRKQKKKGNKKKIISSDNVYDRLHKILRARQKLMLY